MSLSPHVSFRNPQSIHSETDDDYSGEHHHSAQSSSPSTHQSSSPTSEEYPEGAPINPVVFHQPLTSVPTLPDFPDPSPAKEALEISYSPHPLSYIQKTISPLLAKEEE